jgi:hypothetical protein
MQDNDLLAQNEELERENKQLRQEVDSLNMQLMDQGQGVLSVFSLLFLLRFFLRLAIGKNFRA